MRTRISSASIITAVLAIIIIAVGGSMTKADAADTGRPYGGCKEFRPAYVKTEGAAWCRAHGWIARKDALVGPKGHVYWIDMRPCHYEDGSLPGDRQQRHCYWNAGTMGNHRGHSFILDQTKARIVVTYLGSKRHPGWSQYIEAGSVR